MNIQWKAKKSENQDFQVLESVGPWDGSPQQERQHTATYCNTLQHTATHCVPERVVEQQSAAKKKPSLTV